MNFSTIRRIKKQQRIFIIKKFENPFSYIVRENTTFLQKQARKNLRINSSHWHKPVKVKIAPSISVRTPPLALAKLEKMWTFSKSLNSFQVFTALSHHFSNNLELLKKWTKVWLKISKFRSQKCQFRKKIRKKWRNFWQMCLLIWSNLQLRWVREKLKILSCSWQDIWSFSRCGPGLISFWNGSSVLKTISRL